jgi:electron transfer flavoprotein alpha subunit
MAAIPEKSIWAVLEQQDGKLGDGSLELVAEAARLAAKLKTEAVALVAGLLPPELTAVLAHHGAKRVGILDTPPLTVEPLAFALAEVVKKHSPAVLLFVHTVSGADLAARTATLLSVGLATACDRVDTDPQGRLVGTRPVYAGKAATTCTAIGPGPQMATLNLDSLDLKTPNLKNTAEVITLAVETQLAPARVRRISVISGDPRSIPLTEAEVVVSAGMGIGSRTNLKLVEDLANAIGGSVGASRRVVDEGWVPLARQVGLTGKTVRPRLYVACGISGAIQHTLGMKDSRAIIAINTDRNAPIFKIADVAILGDVLKVLPVLTAQVRQTLSQVPKPTVGDVLNAAASVKGKP